MSKIKLNIFFAQNLKSSTPGILNVMIGSNLGLLGERNHMKFNLRVIQVKIEQFPFLTSEHRDRDQEQNTNKLSRSISTETNLLSFLPMAKYLWYLQWQSGVLATTLLLRASSVCSYMLTEQVRVQAPTLK